MHTHTHAHTYTLYVICINNLHKKKPLNNLLFLYKLFFSCFIFVGIYCLFILDALSRFALLGFRADLIQSYSAGAHCWMCLGLGWSCLFSATPVAFCSFSCHLRLFLLICLFFWWAWALTRARRGRGQWRPRQSDQSQKMQKFIYCFVSFEVHEFSLYY